MLRAINGPERPAEQRSCRLVGVGWMDGRQPFRLLSTLRALSTYLPAYDYVPPTPMYWLTGSLAHWFTGSLAHWLSHRGPPSPRVWQHGSHVKWSSARVASLQGFAVQVFAIRPTWKPGLLYPMRKYVPIDPTVH